MEDTIEVRTRDVITLALILDEFSDFNNQVIDLLKNSNDVSYNKFKKLTHNEHLLGAKKLKEFYNNNTKLINIINGYSNIYYFIAYNYDIVNGKINEGFSRLYNYMLENKDKIKTIIDLSIKIERLGFNSIKYNEKYDFTNDTYHISSYSYILDEFNFLDNMYIIPTYSSESIEYKTSGSNYKMVLQKDVSGQIQSKEIYINDLFMDPNRLPEEATKEETLDVIERLRSDIQSQYDILRESVNMGLGIIELKKKYYYIYNIANICDDISIKNKMLNALKDLKEDIFELEYLCDKYSEVITDNNKLISLEKIEKEKSNELIRRKNSLYKED